MDIEKKQTILIVDDMAENIFVLNEILNKKYNIQVATNGEKVLKIVDSENKPDLILLDVMMPNMDGYEVCRRLKKNPGLSKIPVIFVTALGDVNDESKGFEVGGVDYIVKPVSPLVVLARVKTHLELFDQSRVLEERVSDRTRELNETSVEIIRRLGRAVEYMDNETGMHVVRVSYYVAIIAEELGFSKDETDMISNAAYMHDIGKIGVPEKILTKPGRFTEEERHIMQSHCAVGYEILGDHKSKLLQYASVGAFTHHERWDGTGYPSKLKGEDIPLVGRIFAIADVFDALTSYRPYKEPWTINVAIEHMKNQSEKHFDPKIVKIFIKKLPEIINIMEKFKD